MLYFVEISLDGVGVSGSSLINSTHSYPKDCRNVRDMFFSNGSLFIANDCGTLKMDLNSNSHVLLVSSKTRSCTEVHGIVPFGDNGDIVFTDVGSQQVKIASSDGHVEKQAIVMVHVHRFPSQWVYVWKTTKPFRSPMLK